MLGLLRWVTFSRANGVKGAIVMLPFILKMPIVNCNIDHGDVDVD